MSTGHSLKVLDDVVKAGGLALQAEDCLVRAAVHHRGEHGGLVRMQNERYYQFVIWRAVLALAHAELEQEQRCDLTLRVNEQTHYFEMKNWRGKIGISQLPSFRKDVSRLQARPRGYLLIVSINQEESTAGNFSFLADQVAGIGAAARRDFRFSTEDRQGNELEFWIAGWPVLASGEQFA